MLSNFVYFLLIFNHVLIWFFCVLSFFVNFLLDLVEFGWLAFHFVFFFLLVNFGLASVNSSQGSPPFSVSGEFVADFIQVLSDVLSIFPNLYDCRRFC